MSTSDTAGASVGPLRASFDAVGTNKGTLSPRTASIVSPLPGFISSKGGGVPLLLCELPPLLLPASGRRGPRFVRGDEDDIATDSFFLILNNDFYEKFKETHMDL